MKYVEFINQLIREKVLEAEKIVLFGQNINAGSCLSGLTKGLKIQKGFIINSPNSENTLCGLGFGLMLNKVPSILFLKQQDFLLLGIDHLVNTYNVIRQKKPSASFAIIAIVVDSGYEGPQHSLNNFSDFCSIARIPGFSITNNVDAKEIINSHLVSPGFRIIGVSQRLFKKEIIEVEKVYSNEESTLFQYSKGTDLTIVCFNFSLPYGLELNNELRKKGFKVSLFSVNSMTPIKWDELIEDLKKTKRLVIIDDSKSENLPCYNFLAEAAENCQIDKKILIKRDFSEGWLFPSLDQLEINYSDVIAKLF